MYWCTQFVLRAIWDLKHCRCEPILSGWLYVVSHRRVHFCLWLLFLLQQKIHAVVLLFCCPTKRCDSDRKTSLLPGWQWEVVSFLCKKPGAGRLSSQFSVQCGASYPVLSCEVQLQSFICFRMEIRGVMCSDFISAIMHRQYVQLMRLRYQ